MKRIFCTLCVTALTLSCTSAPPQDKVHAPEAGTAEQVPPFLTAIQQLTFNGARAGEGYFSQDGRYLVFQSEREKDNPFYQIYLMDMKTGTSRRISPGQGKTTCSWIHPDNKHILFASTHADPELKKKVAEEWESRKAPKSKYSWSFDDAFEIYETDFNGQGYKNLTNAKGYDAEGSYSPDGKWIAFASNRAAFTGKMSAEEKKAFDRDNSVAMDIYIMRADGSGVKQLTTEPGYDGGPFFSPDGKRITYRHFTVDGTTAEVFTMNIDGSDKKQLSHIKAMSWAPFYHPTGDYLIFTSNKFGYHNFELFIVDVDGKHEPVRVTNLPGFDGLPVFTPDGGNLVWSHTNEKGEAQLFKAKWDDGLARRALGLAPAAKPLQTAPLAGSQAWVEYLASNHMEGRATGSKQEQEYLQTVAADFKALGLQPLNGSYLQKYEFTAGVELDSSQPNQIKFKIGDKTVSDARVGVDWVPLSYSQTGSFPAAEMVFAGHGIVATAEGTQKAFDSYSAADVKDKWAVIYSGIPEDVDVERRYFLNRYAGLQHKAMVARSKGARGLIVIDETEPAHANLSLKFEGRAEDVGIPVIKLSYGLSKTLGTAFKNSSFQADISLRFKRSSAQNAMALLKVPGAKYTVIVGAHGDHLGHGEMGNSLYRGKEQLIHNGADDNASGVAGVIKIAADIAAKVKSGKIQLKQNILFAVWSGEEIGILGSNAFVKTFAGLHPSAYLNLDMIGRYRDKLLIQGTGSAPEWKSLVEQVNLQNPLNVQTLEDPYLPSDALAFYMKGVPVLMAFTGSHAEYHTPKDTADLINYDGLDKIAGWMERMALTLAANTKPMVTYRKVESSGLPGEKRGFRLYLGTIPDYSQEGKAGVVISGTSKGSPAEKAGLQPGDVIVELGGLKIKNLYDYVYCLQALKANEQIKIKVVRAGKDAEMQITPVLKE